MIFKSSDTKALVKGIGKEKHTGLKIRKHLSFIIKSLNLSAS